MATTNVLSAPTKFSDHQRSGPARAAGQSFISSARGSGTRMERKPRLLEPRKAPSMSPTYGGAQRIDVTHPRSPSPTTAGAGRTSTPHPRAELCLPIPADRRAPSRGQRARTLASWPVMPDPAPHAAPWALSSRASAVRIRRRRAVGRRTTRTAGHVRKCVAISFPVESICVRSLAMLDSVAIARLPSTHVVTVVL